jgi:hypothetical protein
MVFYWGPSALDKLLDDALFGGSNVKYLNCNNHIAWEHKGHRTNNEDVSPLQENF